MQRRINQADGDWKAVHCLEDADEVAALERKQLVKSLDARLPAVGEDHLLDGPLTLVAAFRLLEIRKEHVLRTTEPDALRSKLDSFACVLRSVHVGADAEATRIIGPLHERFVGFGKLGND